MRIEDKLDSLKVTPVYYYNGNATICFLYRLQDNCANVLARGVSICSDKDQFTKRIGRVKATGRAIKAVCNSETSEPIRGDNEYSEYLAKSVFLPELNYFECEIVTSHINNRLKYEENKGKDTKCQTKG
jgi:hypothetical protein